MKTSRFKTNAKCMGCVAKIEESLNGKVARDAWKVDLSSPDKVLEITSDLSDETIAALINQAGFKAEKINQTE